jgi:hypothetical protein
MLRRRSWLTLFWQRRSLTLMFSLSMREATCSFQVLCVQLYLRFQIPDYKSSLYL